MPDAPAAPSGTVRLPVIGPTRTRWVVVGGVAVVGIVGYAYLRRRQAAANAPVLDTTTGSLGGDVGFTNPHPVTTVDGSIDQTGDTISTNAEWTQDAINRLQLIGWDPNFAIAAIGKYLDHQPLTTDEAVAVRAARAISGPPPEGTYDIIMVATGSTPGTGGPITSEPPPAPAPAPAPAPVPSSPGKIVRVTKYTSNNPPWDSTVWGIWQHYQTTPSWEAIWNHPLNAPLRALRGDPHNIHANDLIFVPGAS